MSENTNNNKDKKKKKRSRSKFVLPFNQLSDLQKEKELKIGKRGYEYCGHTLKPLCDIDQAVYNPKLDLIFESRRAEADYYKDIKWGNNPKKRAS